MSFSHELRIRYAEVDAQGVAFNAHYLTYLDEAMTRYLEHLGYDPRETFTGAASFDVMLVKTTLEWHGSAGFEDILSIAVAPTRLGSSSFDLEFRAAVADAPVLTATTTYVSVVPGERRSTPIPEDVRAALSA